MGHKLSDIDTLLFKFEIESQYHETIFQHIVLCSVHHVKSNEQMHMYPFLFPKVKLKVPSEFWMFFMGNQIIDLSYNCFAMLNVMSDFQILQNAWYYIVLSAVWMLELVISNTVTKTRFVRGTISLPFPNAISNFHIYDQLQCMRHCDQEQECHGVFLCCIFLRHCLAWPNIT